MGKPRTPRKATAKTAAKNKVNKDKEVTPSAVQKGRRYWLPDPRTRCGAVFYAVAGPVMVTAAGAVADFVLRHVHITIG